MCKPDQINMVIDAITDSDYMEGGKMKNWFLCKLVAVAENEVAEYCKASAEYQAETAQLLEWNNT